jgi:hypothetical protein
MKLREAIAVLLEHTENDCHGAGCGIRSLPSQKEMLRVYAAAQRVWPTVFGYSISDEEVKRRFGYGV